jgi:glycosyltransferase involved in cell wall biosynthesis
VARICVVRQYRFPDDARVRREVTALLGAGHEVDVVCVAAPGSRRWERDGALRILRLPLRHRRGSPLMYVGTYAAFLAMATVAVAALHAVRRYDLVQVNSVPDSLVFSALVPKLAGAKVVLDLHESMPEFYSTKFGVGLDHPVVRAVARLEQASIAFADAALTCTAQQRAAFAARGADPARIEVVLNAADEAIFDPARFPRREQDGEAFTVVCHGTIEPQYGLDTLMRAAALVRDEIPELRVQVFGDGTQREEIEALAAELGLDETVWFSRGYVPYDELVDAIAQADVGAVPMKRDAFRDLTHCNKMFDFVAMGTPAAVARTRAVEAYFDEESFAFFASGDERDLARVLRALHRDPAGRRRLAKHAAAVAEPYRWPRQRARYLAFVERVLAGDGTAQADPERRSVPAAPAPVAVPLTPAGERA